MTILSSRETRARAFLADIAAHNHAGRLPCKSDLYSPGTPSKTRAGQSRIIAGLISRGLVEDTSSNWTRAALRITPAGLDELS